MSQEKLRVMLEKAEDRIEKNQDLRHKELLRHIAQVRSDFAVHVESDRKEHEAFRQQFNNIYKATVTTLVGMVAWIYK